jgi:hypothetical protein
VVDTGELPAFLRNGAAFLRNGAEGQPADEILLSSLLIKVLLTNISCLGTAECGRLGLGICYDIRFPELAQMYTQRGAQLLLYPAAFNMTTVSAPYFDPSPSCNHPPSAPVAWGLFFMEWHVALRCSHRGRCTGSC